MHAFKKTVITSLTLVLQSVAGVCYAQSGFVATGGDALGIGGSASYSVGQVADTVSEGVQQPYEFVTVGVQDNKNINLYCTVYPNPANAYVILKIDLPELQHLSYTLADMNGRLLVRNAITSSQTVLPLESLAAATYLLTITDNKSTLKTFKIIKNQ